jgi:hypothetical protein
MKRAARWLVLAGVLALLVGTADRAQAALIVLPNAQAALEGNDFNELPFNLAPASLTSERYQQVYRASDFGAIPPGGALITQLAFRPDADLGVAFSSTLPDVRIDLSTTAAGPDALSSTFASKWAPMTRLSSGVRAGRPWRSPAPTRDRCSARRTSTS